jgi:saccharopine dehydrogenase (NADP+, L-glutamate forming)
MKKILILGAGRSSVFLIEHLLLQAGKTIELTVADQTLAGAEEKTGRNPLAATLALDVNNREALYAALAEHDIVISMLPATMHLFVAHACLAEGKHLFTASYVSPEMRMLHHEAAAKGLLFMNELGLDPGIDHMSAMQMFDKIKEDEGEITSFKSYCGGLVAPVSNDNPWGYKFSWNPRNVILAGQGTARWLENGKLHYAPYHRLFSESESIHVPGYGAFDAYANRDSLGYIDAYGLHDIRTMKRGTLRQSGFCKAWNALVQMGITDDSFTLRIPDGTPWGSFSRAFLPGDNPSWKQSLCALMHWQEDDHALAMLAYTGIFDDEHTISSAAGSPAHFLQQQLEQKWKLRKGDLDRVVMIHEVEYLRHGKQHQLSASLVLDGNSDTHTAMAKTVGLPLAVFTLLFVQGKIKATGVHIPVSKEIYEPVMEGLGELGISFHHA